MLPFRRWLARLLGMPSLSSADSSPARGPISRTSSVASADKGPARGSISPAAASVNALGLDLLARIAPTGNALLSPFSIQSALAMTYAGADGITREEMRRVLHYPADDEQVHKIFAALRASLEEIAVRSVQRAASATEWGGSTEPVTLIFANRLFGQKSYHFRPAFLELLKTTYGAPLQPVDFRADPAGACREINAWVEEQTHQRIRDLIPSLTPDSSLVLVNAIYLKAPWAHQFEEAATKPRPFHVDGGKPEDRPTMVSHSYFGYRRQRNYTAVTMPYEGAELQLLVIVPDEVDGLAAVEATLSAAELVECAAAPATDVILFLPKFRVEPPLMSLGATLCALGMRTAFDSPPGSANFERMAPRRDQDYLAISAIFHKTFLALDENGTEAAAAAAVEMLPAGAYVPTPVRLQVDRPFLFAIQHRATGSCLFLGRVCDPK